MTKRTAALTSMLVLALGIAAFTGSALAANGNGNSANAPGQVKKSDTTSSSTAAQGVKPDSSTAHGNHNTSCTTGGGTGSSATCTSAGSKAATAQTAAHSDASKRYGNDTTAAQVANSHGAPAGTRLTAPGNSQPHKVTDCKHRHAVDVHAVKSYSSTACTRQSVGPTSSTSSTSNTSNTSPATVVTATGYTAVTGAKDASTSASTPGTSQGGVLGALTAVGQGSLPFTGVPLWIAAAAALGLIALGACLRRHTRVTA